MASNALLRYSLRLILWTWLFSVIGSASPEVIFKADFETGDLSEWSQTGTRSQNATPRNVQVVTDIVQQGKYAGKFTIHEDDLFNAQQLRVQVGELRRQGWVVNHKRVRRIPKGRTGLRHAGR